MSRVANNPIDLPDGVKASVVEQQQCDVGTRATEPMGRDRTVRLLQKSTAPSEHLAACARVCTVIQVARVAPCGPTRTSVARDGLAEESVARAPHGVELDVIEWPLTGTDCSTCHPSLWLRI